MNSIIEFLNTNSTLFEFVVFLMVVEMVYLIGRILTKNRFYTKVVISHDLFYGENDYEPKDLVHFHNQDRLGGGKFKNKEHMPIDFKDKNSLKGKNILIIPNRRLLTYEHKNDIFHFKFSDNSKILDGYKIKSMINQPNMNKRKALKQRRLTKFQSDEFSELMTFGTVSIKYDNLVYMMIDTTESKSKNYLLQAYFHDNTALTIKIAKEIVNLIMFQEHIEHEPHHVLLAALKTTNFLRNCQLIELE